MEANLIEIHGLRKQFGSLAALDGVDLTVGRGKIVGLLGPNGSGKTTLIKILNGLLCPTAGSVLVDGHAPGLYTKAAVSYLPDKPYFSPWMRVRDAIELFQDFYKDFDRVKADDMCRMMELDESRQIKTLSKGTQEKMQLMLVMSRHAQLYLLDEPIAGVDPAARDAILDTILTNYCENSTVVISTHLISDIEKVLDEAVFLKKGRIVLHDSVEAIRERAGKSVDAYFREVFRVAPVNGGNETCSEN